MKNIYRELANKFFEANQSPKIYKKFSFTMEDIQDNPEVMEKIVEYLEKHQDEYEDYRILKWVDETTFAPQVMLEITPKGEILSLMITDIDKFVDYFNKRHESQFEIIKIEISHEELMSLSGYQEINEAIDYLNSIHDLKIDKEKFHSIEVITEMFQEAEGNQRLKKPEIVIRMLKKNN